MREIGFLIAQDFAIMHLALAQEAIRIANRLQDDADLQVRIYCPNDQVVSASNGQLLWPTHSLWEESLPDALFVIVSLYPQQAYDDSVKGLLNRFYSSKGLLGAIDCGALFLAKNGLLDHQRVAVHWEYAPVFAELFPQIDVCTDAVMRSGRLLTCSGGLAVGQMMVETVAHLHSRHLAEHLAQVLNYSRMEPQGFASHVPIRNVAKLDIVEQTFQLMRQHLGVPLKLTQLVARLPISQRTLIRRFQQQGLASPMQEYLRLRLDLAKQLLEESQLSVQQAAHASGFSSAAHLSKAFLQHFNQRPGAVRRAILAN